MVPNRAEPKKLKKGERKYQKPGKKIYQESERTKVHVTMYPSSKQYFTNPAQISFYLAPNQ